MALSIKDAESERLARGLARRRDTGLTAVIRMALQNESARGDSVREEAARRFDVALRRARSMVRDGVVDSLLTPDEILGYDEDGIPEQR